MMKQLNAAICMLNSKYIHSSLAPWYLLAGIEAYGVQSVSAEVVEGTVNMALQDVANRIISKSPQVIGFCCYIWNIAYIKKLLPVIKNALPETVIILGGPEVSFNAGDVLRDEPLIDYVISGEGELPFARLLDVLGRSACVGMDDTCTVPVDKNAADMSGAGLDAGSIPGVCYRNGNYVVVVPSHCPTDEPPNPYVKQYFEALNGRIAYLETSRGCPFSCAFCLSGRMGSVRFFDMERAKRDLLLLANSGTQTVKLVDRTFNVNHKRAREIFGFIIENYGGAIPNGIRFHFEIAGDLLDNETLDLLGAAPMGAFQFEIGLQSFNTQTLEAINRKTDIELLKTNIERLISFGTIHIHIDLIAGLPYEDFKSFADSFNTAYALKPHMLQLGFLKLLHGSPMREEREFSSRYSPEAPYEVLETPWLTADELCKLHSAEDALERLYNSGRFRRTLGYVLEKSGQTPFELFLHAGSCFGENTAGRMSLDDLIGVVYDYFGNMDIVNKMALRDVMVCDRLTTNSTGRLPKALQVMDKILKKALSQLNNQHDTRPVEGIKRGYALLQTESALVYVDYRNKNQVTGEFTLQKYMPDFITKKELAE